MKKRAAVATRHGESANLSVFLRIQTRNRRFLESSNGKSAVYFDDFR